MIKTISETLILTGFLFLFAFSGCHLIRKSQAASEGSPRSLSSDNKEDSWTDRIRGFFQSFMGGKVRSFEPDNKDNPCNKDNYQEFIHNPGNFYCDLRGADLREIDCAGANFSFADLRGADLSETNCERANFFRAKVDEANFEGSDLIRAIFKWASVRDVNFRDTNLGGATFEASDLLGSDFGESRLLYTVFFMAKIDEELREYAENQGATFGMGLDRPRSVNFYRRDQD